MDYSTWFKINSPNVVHETIDNEVVIIEFKTGNYYSLEKTGADIWEWIEQGFTLGEIIEFILNRYECSTAEIEDALGRFINQLQEENLVSVNSMQVSPPKDKPNQKIDPKQPFEIPILLKYSDMQELLLLDPIHEVDETGWPSAKFIPPEDQKN